MAGIIENRFINFVSSIEKITELEITAFTMGEARNTIVDVSKEGDWCCGAAKDDNWRCAAAAIISAATWYLGGTMGAFFCGPVDGNLCKLVASIHMPDKRIAELRFTYKRLDADIDRKFTLNDVMFAAAFLCRKITGADVTIDSHPAGQSVALGISQGFRTDTTACEDIIGNFFLVATSAQRVPVEEYDIKATQHSGKLMAVRDPSVQILIDRVPNVGENATPYGLFTPVWTKDQDFVMPEPDLIPLNVNEIGVTTEWQIDERFRAASEKVADTLAKLFGASKSRLLSAKAAEFKYGVGAELTIGMVIDGNSSLFCVVCGDANRQKLSFADVLK